MRNSQLATNYRPEIDGLRAVAVLSVIVFHLYPSLFPGGFVGVDVFFVISGYLVTRNILTSLESSRFTFSDFYARRIQRLYPTYLTVMIFSSVMVYCVFPPSDTVGFAQSLISSLVYFSNVYFAATAGYFDSASHVKPLLHTWSLSIEEQFYLLIPLILLIGFRTRFNSLWMMAAIVIVSFLLNLLTIYASPTQTFYFIYTRAWELGIGSLLAYGCFPRVKSELAQLAVFLLGVLLIITGFIIIDETTRFPGYAALIPVMGTYFVIGSSTNLRDHPILRIFSNRLMVKVGLLSYALYLWHWVLIVFYKKYFGLVSISIVDAAVLLSATFLLSVLSTNYIEPIFRKRRFGFGSTMMISGGLSACLAAFSIMLIQTQGGLFRWPSERSIYADTLEHKEKTFYQECGSIVDPEIEKYCRRYGSENTNAEIVVWGDSHAVEFTRALASLTNASVISFSTPGCPPINGVQRSDNLGTAIDCNRKLNDRIFQFLMEYQPKKVVLVARWSLYHLGWYKNGTLQIDTHYLCIDDCEYGTTPEESLEAFDAGLKTTVKSLDTVSQVYLVKAAPELPVRGDYLLFDNPTFSGQRLDAHERMNYGVNAVIDSLQDRDLAVVVDPTSSLCDQTKCLFRSDDLLFYLDDNHLTDNGWMQAKTVFSTLLTTDSANNM
ncbi:O-acetyltransferase OatA [BD1-7 clade bacterium]|uniref:O-acetyltransferase OatA n=1 Tax=BD1-7 clade bacterium TaxID=2029982 RepID=A0A5S9PKT1_9GAMM|nr:O-acetyltransferase OatA [BD1-7 clade bacterium]